MDGISSMWMSPGWCQCYFLKLDGVDISRERIYLNSAYGGFVLKKTQWSIWHCARPLGLISSIRTVYKYLIKARTRSGISMSSNYTTA